MIINFNVNLKWRPVKRLEEVSWMQEVTFAKIAVSSLLWKNDHMIFLIKHLVAIGFLLLTLNQNF